MGEVDSENTAPEKSEQKPRYPLEFTIAGIAALFYSMKFGTAVFACVGLPVLFACLYLGGGGRKPSTVPKKDALIYIGIGLALVIGIILYVILTTPAK